MYLCMTVIFMLKDFIFIMMILNISELWLHNWYWRFYSWCKLTLWSDTVLFGRLVLIFQWLITFLCSRCYWNGNVSSSKRYVVVSWICWSIRVQCSECTWQEESRWWEAGDPEFLFSPAHDDVLLQTSPRTRRTQSQTGRITITIIIITAWGILLVVGEVCLEVENGSLSVPDAHVLSSWRQAWILTTVWN